MKDKIISFVIKGVLLCWIFANIILMLQELLYGESLILSFVFFLFAIRGAGLYFKDVYCKEFK